MRTFSMKGFRSNMQATDTDRAREHAAVNVYTAAADAAVNVYTAAADATANTNEEVRR